MDLSKYSANMDQLHLLMWNSNKIRLMNVSEVKAIIIIAKFSNKMNNKI